MNQADVCHTERLLSVIAGVNEQLQRYSRMWCSSHVVSGTTVLWSYPDTFKQILFALSYQAPGNGSFFFVELYFSSSSF